MSEEAAAEVRAHMERPALQTIDLDTDPFSPSPGDLIGGVVKGTVLEDKVQEPVSKLFGNWTYAFPDVTPEEWKEAQKVTAPRIKALYHQGIIRYGSW